MNTSLFIKTYKNDFKWLKYSLESVHRNLAGITEIVIVTDQGTGDELKAITRPLPLEVTIIEEYKPEECHGYLWQQVIKLQADTYFAQLPDHIMMVDSDTVFRPGACVSNWFDDSGRVKWPITSKEELDESHPWFKTTELWIGHEVHYEFMRALPLVIPSYALKEIRNFTFANHGCSIAEYVLSHCKESSFSEFNAMGAHMFYSKGTKPIDYNISFINTKEPAGLFIRDNARQFWSHDELEACIPEITTFLQPLDGSKLMGVPPSKNIGDSIPFRDTDNDGLDLGIKSVEKTLSNDLTDSELDEIRNRMLERSPQGFYTLSGDSHIGAWAKQTGRLDHDHHTLDLFSPYIDPNRAVIDVGAYIGDHTIYYLRKTQSIVFAFEPSRPAFECLIRNCPAAVCYNIALGSESGSKQIAYADKHNYGTNFLVDVSNHSDPNSSDLKAADQIIECRTMDSVVTCDIGFIKVDTEGFELNVLMGANNILAKYKPSLLLEVVPSHMQRANVSLKDLFCFLKFHGYMPLYGIGDPVQSDILFISTAYRGPITIPAASGIVSFASGNKEGYLKSWDSFESRYKSV